MQNGLKACSSFFYYQLMENTFIRLKFHENLAFKGSCNNSYTLCDISYIQKEGIELALIKL